MEKSWFESWFDSEYYHILYKNRDEKEARKFIKNLVDFFKILPEHQVQDLACGKGRHSIYLNSLGVNVLGVDLSENSIHYAKMFQNETLSFEVHDMREIFAVNRFDFVLNLFTSFGYFENDEDNLKTIQAVSESLKPNGIFLIDFFNAKKIIKNLIPFEIKIIQNIEFEIKKQIVDRYIVKDISFVDKGKSFSFTEKVQYFNLEDFEALFQQSGLKLMTVFGDYDLNKFDVEKSDRLIIAFQKQTV